MIDASPRFFKRFICFGVLLLSLSSGCTSVNRQLNDLRTPLERRKANATRAALFAEALPPLAIDEQRIVANAADDAGVADPVVKHKSMVVDKDGWFVGVAISGGGSRSANFAAATMLQLQRVGFLQHVDYISSVSGGSLAAAYYCVAPDFNTESAQERLTHPFAHDVIMTTVQPWFWLALTLTNWDRSDLLASSFQKHVFSRHGRALTFSDLREDRPRLLINATQLQSGKRFIFCNEMFDQMNSDLGRYPLASAVAASSAVPVLMNHVTLRDFSSVFKQYHHLLDGGVVDNLGVQTLIETYQSQVKRRLDAGMDNPYPKGGIVIVIDAKARFDARLSDKGDIPLFQSLAAGAGLSSTALINRASAATLAEIIVQNSSDAITAKQLREDIEELTDTGLVVVKDKYEKDVHVVHFALSRVNNLSNLPFEGFSDSVNTIATYYNIGRTEAHHLYLAAELLMKEKPLKKDETFEMHIRRLVDLIEEKSSTTRELETGSD